MSKILILGNDKKKILLNQTNVSFIDSYVTDIAFPVNLYQYGVRYQMKILF